MPPTPKIIVPRNPERCLRCRKRYLYWVRGSESVIRCFSPCDNAGVVEEPRRQSQGVRGLMAELTAPRPAPPRRIGLSFTLDVDDEGRHVVVINASGVGVAERIDVSQIDATGGMIMINGSRKPLNSESLSVLVSIRSLKPEVQDERLVFSFSPNTLLALRRLLRVRETERSSEIRVKAGSPIIGITVDYKPDVGVTVAPNFADAGGHKVEGSAVERREGYLKVGDTFYLLDDAAEKAMSLSEKPVDVGDIPEFFLRDLVLLRSEFSAVLTDRASKINITEDYLPPTVVIDYSEPGWLDFNVVYDPRTDAPGLPVSDDGRYVRTDDYTWAKRVEVQRRGDEENLKKLGAKKTPKGYRLGLYAYKSLEEFIEEIGGLKKASEDYREFLDKITDFRGDDEYRLPAKIEEHLESHERSLFPYQRSGIQWLNWLFEHNLHGLLADDMGLGKTLQSLVSMRYMYEEVGASEPSLVICPVAVMRHWEKEIAAVFPRTTVVRVYHGQGRRLEPLDGKRIIYVSSYDTVVADIEELGSIAWFFVVLDEGTRIKNPGTQRAGAVKTLNAAHKLALSGTPIENRPAELWSLFDFLMRDHLGTYHEFLWRYEKPIVEGDAAQVEELKRRIRPFILRRKKEQVAKELPEKIQMGYWVSLTGEQKLLYQQIQDSEVAPMEGRIRSGQRVGYIDSVLPVIMKLRQLCDHPAMIDDVWEPVLGRSEKFDLVCEKIGEIWEGGESCVVFTNFIGTLNLLEEYLKGAGLRYIRIDGQTRDRQGLIDAFNGGGYAAALCSVLASGHGINLTAANHVIHVDNWFSPAIEDQATDRVHRIGQTRTVYIHKILVENTLEEKIDALIKRKRRVIDGVIDAGLEGEKFWSKSELLEILRPL